tara:strand:+ start:2214 stop:2618 length:405 start_codon:yes stop_codon:yes gene_type:complete
MNAQINIRLDLSPVACPRPRVTKNGVYYPKRYTTFKTVSKALLMNQCKMFIQKQQNIHIDYLFICKRQSALCKGKQRVYKATRPDLDNYIKAINDSLQSAGIIEDDSQIVSLSGKKMFSAPKEDPFIQLTITLL